MLKIVDFFFHRTFNQQSYTDYLDLRWTIKKINIILNPSTPEDIKTGGFFYSTVNKTEGKEPYYTIHFF